MNIISANYDTDGFDGAKNFDQNTGTNRSFVEIQSTSTEMTDTVQSAEY